MEKTADLLGGVAAVMWPVVFLIVVFKFSGPVRDLLSSIGKRKVSVKVGGTELTLAEFTEQQQVRINEIEAYMVGMADQVSFPVSPDDEGETSNLQQSSPEKYRVGSLFVPAFASVNPVQHILWVDGDPVGNAMVRARFSALGINVDTVLSTENALRKLKTQRYDLVISDMGRSESGQHNEKAGVDLVREIRRYDSNLPLFVYCSSLEKEKFGGESRSAGASEVVSSSVELLQMLTHLGKGGESEATTR